MLGDHHPLSPITHQLAYPMSAPWKFHWNGHCVSAFCLILKKILACEPIIILWNHDKHSSVLRTYALTEAFQLGGKDGNFVLFSGKIARLSSGAAVSGIGCEGDPLFGQRHSHHTWNLDKAPRLSIRIVIWILPSHTLWFLIFPYF